ncbi:MAG: helix-hairpin-helix domain-containing protein, partial [Candidatus Margulisiibacteriota bacterium]
LEQWDKLPGISPKVAQHIVEFRLQNGPFHAVEDLLKIKGIGPKTLGKVRQYIFLD